MDVKRLDELQKYAEQAVEESVCPDAVELAKLIHDLIKAIRAKK